MLIISIVLLLNYYSYEASSCTAIVRENKSIAPSRTKRERKREGQDAADGGREEERRVGGSKGR